MYADPDLQMREVQVLLPMRDLDSANGLRAGAVGAVGAVAGGNWRVGRWVCRVVGRVGARVCGQVTQRAWGL